MNINLGDNNKEKNCTEDCERLHCKAAIANFEKCFAPCSKPTQQACAWVTTNIDEAFITAYNVEYHTGEYNLIEALSIAFKN